MGTSPSFHAVLLRARIAVVALSARPSATIAAALLTGTIGQAALACVADLARGTAGIATYDHLCHAGAQTGCRALLVATAVAARAIASVRAAFLALAGWDALALTENTQFLFSRTASTHSRASVVVATYLVFAAGDARHVNLHSNFGIYWDVQRHFHVKPGQILCLHRIRRIQQVHWVRCVSGVRSGNIRYIRHIRRNHIIPSDVQDIQANRHLALAIRRVDPNLALAVRYHLVPVIDLCVTAPGCPRIRLLNATGDSDENQHSTADPQTFHFIPHWGVLYSATPQ